MGLFQHLERRRTQLGMSRSALAQRSGVSVPTVNRILSGHGDKASLANVLALATALGLDLTASETLRVDELRRQQATKKARRLVRVVQGTSALEGQAVSPDEIEKLVAKTSRELLASKRKLWAD